MKMKFLINFVPILYISKILSVFFIRNEKFAQPNLRLKGNIFSVKDAPPTPSQVPAEPVKPSRLKAGGYNGDRYLIYFLNYGIVEMRSKLKMKLRFLFTITFSFIF